jgi:hypothetical protein
LRAEAVAPRADQGLDRDDHVRVDVGFHQGNGASGDGLEGLHREMMALPGLPAHAHDGLRGPGNFVGEFYNILSLFLIRKL